MFSLQFESVEETRVFSAAQINEFGLFIIFVDRNPKRGPKSAEPSPIVIVASVKK